MHASIAYIAGRLILGKSISSIFDYEGARHIGLGELPHADSLKNFDYGKPALVRGGRSSLTYRFSLGPQGALELNVNGSSFIAKVAGTPAHFAGTVRGDSVYLYDHESASHFNYRVVGCVIDAGADCSVCAVCGLGRR